VAFPADESFWHVCDGQHKAPRLASLNGPGNIAARLSLEQFRALAHILFDFRVIERLNHKQSFCPKTNVQV